MAQLQIFFFLLAVIAIFSTFTRAQEPDPQPEDGNVSFVQISISTRVPSGYEVIDWQKAIAKLSPACGEGFGTDKLIKNGAGERNFFIYSVLPVDMTFDVFKQQCEDAFVANKDELKVNGKVQLTELVLVELPIACATECGNETCPPCPLLHVCTDDVQCGEHAKCATSERDPATSWCLSSNAVVQSTLFATILILAAFLF